MKAPRFYFSFWSPYSWIAARLLEERLDAGRFGLRYTPYWPPDATTLDLLKGLGGEFLYVHMTRQKHLYILQDIKRIAQSLGTPFTWPIDDKPWLDLPHLAYLAAERLGRGREFFWAAHRARWQQGRNVCVRETIRELAGEVGLPADALANAPEDPGIRRAGAEALLAAYRDQVFGVPFFVKGFQRYWGVDRLGAFMAELEGRPYRYLAGGALSGTIEWEDGPPLAPRPEPEVETEAAAALGAYDQDSAGGCG